MAKENTDLPHNLVAFVNDPVSEQVIAKVIQEKTMAYAEAKQGSCRDAVEFLKQNRSPKILIIDISDSELPLGDIAKLKEHSTPNMNIIVVGSRNDVGLFRDLMNEGVSDYLVKPLNTNIIRKAVDDANGIKHGSIVKTGKMMQFISSVGGAGSTTAVSNVGWILANKHFKRSLVMDIDFLYGTSNLMLDLKTENAYLDILESPDKIDDYFIETILRKHGNRLYYLGGLVDLVRGINVDIDAFEAMLDIIKRQFNYILIDSQREISPINRLCMDKTDVFIIMVEMSVASAQNTARLLEYLNTTQSKKKVLLVANKVGFSSGGALPKESFEQVVDRKIDYIMPLDENLALAAANIGQPVAASGGSLGAALEDLTDDILGKRENASIIKQLEEEAGWTVDKVQRVTTETLGKIKHLLGGD